MSTLAGAVVGSHLSVCGERMAYSQVSLWICGGMPEFCEAVVELFCSSATLYLNNLRKKDAGGHGCLFSLMSSGPLTNTMKSLRVFMVTTGQCQAQMCFKITMNTTGTLA